MKRRIILNWLGKSTAYIPAFGLCSGMGGTWILICNRNSFWALGIVLALFLIIEAALWLGIGGWTARAHQLRQLRQPRQDRQDRQATLSIPRQAAD